MGITEPPTPTSPDTSRALPPRRLLRNVQGFIVVAVAVDVIACLASGPYYLFATIIPWICATVALVVSIVVIIRNRRRRHTIEQRVLPRQVLSWLAIALLFFVIQSAACINMNRIAMLCDCSSASSANLRGILQATMIYHDKFKIRPDSLWDLQRADLTSAKQMVAPGDFITRNAFATSINPTFIPSYVFRPEFYMPNSGTGDIVVYEREPWSVHDFRALPTRVHAAIAGDGHVKYLTPKALAAELNASH